MPRCLPLFCNANLMVGVQSHITLQPPIPGALNCVELFCIIPSCLPAGAVGQNKYAYMGAAAVAIAYMRVHCNTILHWHCTLCAKYMWHAVLLQYDENVWSSSNLWTFQSWSLLLLLLCCFVHITKLKSNNGKLLNRKLLSCFLDLDIWLKQLSRAELSAG